MFDLIPSGHREKNLFDYLDKFEKDFFTGLRPDFPQFRTDVIDKDDKFILKADLPGFSKEEIKIEVNDNYLIINAEHNEETEDKNTNFIRRERKYGTFSRSFDISNINSDNIESSFKNGVLEINLPKKEIAAKNPARQIEIK